MKHILMTVLFCTCILSCAGQVKKQRPYIIIDVEGTLHNPKLNKLTLNDFAKDIRIIPVETNDSVLFRYLRIAGVTDSHILIYDDDAVYFINKKDGKVNRIINKKGQGPGEYANIGHVTVNVQDRVIYIAGGGKINLYDFYGNFIKSVPPKDLMGDFEILPDGNFAANFVGKAHRYALGIYDSAFNLKRTGMPRINGTADYELWHYSGIKKFNNECYYRDTHCDTLFHITSEYEKPYIVLHRGKYKPTGEVLRDVNKAVRENRYIYYDDVMLISKYCFVHTAYDRNRHFDIWNIENSKQIYKNYSDEEGHGYGIPVTIGDITLNVWPMYADGNTMYCSIEADNAIKLIPSLPEDTNPILLEIKLPD